MDDLQNSIGPFDARMDAIGTIHDTLRTLKDEAEIILFVQQLQQKINAPRNGFSLVELSIVLVILGLLVGGVLSGQSLIHAAELRTVVRDEQKYITATRAFRDKYFALPGDMPNATSFWSAAAACPGTNATAAGGTCNGDGDGQIMQAATTTNPGNESFRYWQQLALAGMIEGSFLGTVNSASASTYTLTAGVNAPKATIGNATWEVIWAGTVTGFSNFFPGAYANILVYANLTTQSPAGPAYCSFKPEDSWNVDTKIDDGKPTTGMLTSTFFDSASVCGGTCVDGTGTGYNLTSSTNSCDMVFKSGF